VGVLVPDPRAQRTHQAARILGPEWLPQAEPEFVRTFSNDVYRLRESGAQFFLRITSGGRRSESELLSELRFVQFLATSGVPVSEPVPSRDGRLLHRTEIEGDVFYACVFREAAGSEFAKLPSAEKREFFRLAGRSMGLLHRVAGRFIPPGGFERPDWRQDRWVRFPELVPVGEREAWRLFRELQEWTHDLPRDRSTFGLIHGDFTILNMRIQSDRITLFDFDSCCEHWYGYEIATFLHYFGGQDDAGRRPAYHEVLEGYGETGSLLEETVASIPMFGKMRLLYSFLVFAETWGFDGLSPEQAEYFAHRRRLFAADATWPPR
jgi:Ser/Thr protein kinase RdoA (MazF antagonist)